MIGIADLPARRGDMEENVEIFNLFSTDIFGTIFSVAWYILSAGMAVYCYIRGAKMSSIADEYERIADSAEEDRDKALKELEEVKGSVLLLNSYKTVTKRLLLGGSCYKLVTDIDLPIEVFVYPSAAPTINKGVKEEIALSIARELVDTDLMTIEWVEVDGVRHAQGSIKIMPVASDHWF